MAMKHCIHGAVAGMIAGAAVSMLVMPKKKSAMKSGTGRAIKMLGEIVESFTDMVRD